MRGADDAPDSLCSTVAERERFTLFEGGFYGNLFSENPTGFVCAPNHEISAAGLASLNRVCTETTGQLTPDGFALTRCGYVLGSRCETTADAGAPGGPPIETIFVYLDPTGREASSREEN
jgi:hypothetical protein